MRGTVLHAPYDVRVEPRDDPEITAPTDAIIRVSAACVCGSDLWDYRGINPVTEPHPMGHEYVGVVGSPRRTGRRTRPSSTSSPLSPAARTPRLRRSH